MANLHTLRFRPIRPNEIPEASSLVDAAYKPQIETIYSESSPLHRWRHYDETKIQSYVEREPKGVRVGLWQGRIVTFNVCRSYGRLGWFHTLAVHPEFQGRGWGKEAVRDGEAYLESQGVSTIAMMTWPTAIRNLAFYQLLGYRQGGLSLYAYRQTSTAILTGRSPFYASVDTMRDGPYADQTTKAVRALCSQIMPGLNYLPWVLWARKKPFAETLLLWREGKLQALALFYFFHGMHWAEGKLLLLAPGLSATAHRWVLEHIRLWVLRRGRDAFGLPVDLSGRLVRDVLLPAGFRLYPESMVNMVKGEALPDPDLHLVRFGG